MHYTLQQREVLKDDLRTYAFCVGKVAQPVKDNEHRTISVYRYRAGTAAGPSDTIPQGSPKDLISNAAYAP